MKRIEKLEDWNLEVIRTLLREGYYETDWFEFKRMLPVDDNSKYGLRMDVCAFANSGGGFLIFGVDNNKDKSAEERLIGVSPNPEFDRDFGHIVNSRDIIPQVEWKASNPPIKVSGTNEVHIIHAHKSEYRPHGVFRDNRYYFSKRLQQATAPILYEELKNMFNRERDIKAKLNMLSLEISLIVEDTLKLLLTVEKQKNTVVCRRINAEGLTILIHDAKLILQKNPSFFGDVIMFRSDIQELNDRMNLIAIKIGSADSKDLSQIVEEHNMETLRLVKGIRKIGNKIKSQLLSLNLT